MRFVHDPSPQLPECTCGWPRPADRIPNLGHCFVCHEPVTNREILNHIRLIHPDEYGDGPDLWPDGRVVIEDADVTPEEIIGDPAA